ncbi:MAG: MraY family glycosyltransferase [Planctomycetia bacterium]|nr:MraY family glycosyltransferase [Planctomycetia bacterium]
MWLIAGALLPSMLICWTAAWLVRRYASDWGLVDRPGSRKIHAQPMPTSGGLAIWLGVVGPFALGQLALWLLPSTGLAARLPESIAVHLPGLAEQSGRLWALLAGATAMMLLGLADDRLLAAVMLMVPEGPNHQPQLFVGGFLLVVVGSLVGFLGHNAPPARLFMGDAGSYLVGYLLATATLSATFAGSDLPPHAILAPLCVLAVPLYDTLTVVAIRLRNGRSPFVGDKSHFSHRLVELGMTKPQAVLTIYLATATCGLGALLLHQVNTAGACVVLLLVACVLVLVGILETVRRRGKR